MEKSLLEIEAQQKELNIRIAGLEYMVEDSVVQLVGTLAAHLANNGHLSLKAFECDLRKDFNSDLTMEDSTGILYSRLADLVSFYRKDGLGHTLQEAVHDK